jgi:hypothetical protein
MNRILIIIGLIIAIATGSFFAGYQVKAGRCATAQLETLGDAVEDSNEDAEAIIETRTEIANERVKVVEKIVQLPPIVVESECPLTDVIQLQQSIYEALAKVPVQ